MRTMRSAARLPVCDRGFLLAVAVPAASAASPPSSGVNDWSCLPSSDHPEPVVLVHGLFANANDNF